jgi:hypothetical protein
MEKISTNLSNCCLYMNLAEMFFQHKVTPQGPFLMYTFKKVPVYIICKKDISPNFFSEEIQEFFVDEKKDEEIMVEYEKREWRLMEDSLIKKETLEDEKETIDDDDDSSSCKNDEDEDEDDDNDALEAELYELDHRDFYGIVDITEKEFDWQRNFEMRRSLMF